MKLKPIHSGRLKRASDDLKFQNVIQFQKSKIFIMPMLKKTLQLSVDVSSFVTAIDEETGTWYIHFVNEPRYHILRKYAPNGQLSDLLQNPIIAKNKDIFPPFGSYLVDVNKKVSEAGRDFYKLEKV